MNYWEDALERMATRREKLNNEYARKIRARRTPLGRQQLQQQLWTELARLAWLEDFARFCLEHPK